MRHGLPGRYIGGFHAMTASDVRFFRRCGLAMVAVGLAIALGFGAMLVQALAFAARSVPVPAIVTGLHAWPRERGRPLVSAEFAMTLPDGRRLAVLGASAQRACCRVGETVLLRVDPAEPGLVRTAAEAEAWGTPAALAALGLIFAALGGVGVRVARRGASLATGGRPEPRMPRPSRPHDPSIGGPQPPGGGV